MTTTKPIRGIIGACLTPFDVNDRIDYKALEKEIEFLVPDCDAITVAAVEAAEYTMLSRDERKEILKVATEMIGESGAGYSWLFQSGAARSHRVGGVFGQSRRRFHSSSDAAPTLGRPADHRRADGVLHSSRVGKSIAGNLLS